MSDPSLLARRTVVVATSNRGKLAEFRELLSDLPIELVAIADIVDTGTTGIEVVEDADSFLGNARKKASVVANTLALPALGDDSGLEVDALGGRPGLRSARYAGEGATDAENNAKLLGELARTDTPGPHAARFQCALVVVDPGAPTERFESTGTCEGYIVSAPRGTGGFGYDPIFLVDALGESGAQRTMAELTSDEKHIRSHRARAVAALKPQLRRWLGV